MRSTDAANDKPSGVPRFRLQQLLLSVAVLCVLVLPIYRYLNNLGHATWMRASPFTDVQVDEDAAWVEFRGARYELVSINNASVKSILSSARHRYGYRGEKRFIEDLPEVLAGMGFEQKPTVSLVLRDSDGEELTVADAPMTANNRYLVMEANDSRQR